jgi:sarcosine oxidase
MIGSVPEDRRCIVVGAGLIGLSTAWALCRRGWAVTVLEAAGSIGHAGSGSKGDARIFRLGYPEPLYVELAIRAEALWRELEAATGRTLLRATGQVSFGDEGALSSIATALSAHDRATQFLTPDDVTRRFPGFATYGPALFEPDSGVLAADACLTALCDATRFELMTGHPVTLLEQRSDLVRVTTAAGDVLEADVVADCAGPRSLALLGDGWPARVAAGPSIPQVAYFRAAEPGTPARLPVFIEWGPDMVYGLPVLGTGAHAGTYKVSHHTPGTPLDRFDPLDATSWGDEPSLLARLTDAARRFLPTLDPHPVATERCVYDNSADQDFVIDRIGSVLVGCGTSGHAFKFGPLIGDVLADLADGRPPSFDMTRFRLDRGASTGAGSVAAKR